MSFNLGNKLPSAIVSTAAHSKKSTICGRNAVARLKAVLLTTPVSFVCKFGTLFFFQSGIGDWIRQKTGHCYSDEI